MSADRFVCDLDACPECGAQWAYKLSRNRRYTHLIAVQSREQDRTIGWRCPGCDKQWDRSATVAGTPQAEEPTA